MGAEPSAAGGSRFRVWAPKRSEVQVVLNPRMGEGGKGVPLASDGAGYFAGDVSGAGVGSRYGFLLDGRGPYPDPASRFQPEGPHGPSEVVEPVAFPWADGQWTGAALEGQVIYEMHIGTFTREGTWAAAERLLPVLAATGVTVLELMPVAEFAGRFGWGYDGVDLYAPYHEYGRPDDFRHFVDAAHRQRLAVILDVVYNHLGPDGNYLKEYADAYFTDRYRNEWGEAINYDGPDSVPVREFIVENAGHWIAEYHLDGLRLDATQTIYDTSVDHILTAVARRVRQAGGSRSTLLIAENEPQHVKLVRPVAEGGYGLDALWNDDLHHSMMVALAGRNEAYYSDHLGTPQELVSAAKRGYLFQGQYYAWQRKPRGTPAYGVAPPHFVAYLENHDQVANSCRGTRLHELTSPGRFRAMTAYLLLGPQTPMLFQGQEFGASSPFLYFGDQAGHLADGVKRGRAEFLAQFPSLASATAQQSLADPSSEETFIRSKLDPGERERHQAVCRLHQDLLALRREDPAFRAQRPNGVDGAVLSAEAFVLRYFTEDAPNAREADRLLLVNLGRDLKLEPLPEPLLAPPEHMRWELLWSSEEPRYGGCGTPDIGADAGWRLPGHAAVVLRPVPARVEPNAGSDAEAG